MDGSEVDFTTAVSAELAQALLATAQAATPAQAAATATAVQGSATESSGQNKKDLAKLIPRPAVFHPSDREQETLQWRDWFRSLKQYLIVVDSAAGRELVPGDRLGAHGWPRTRKVKIPLQQGRLICVIKDVDNYNGHEALRQLEQDDELIAGDHVLCPLQHEAIHPAPTQT